MPTPCYISITGQTQEILLQVHLPLILSATSMCRGTKTRCWCRNSCITLLSRPILSPVSLRVSVLTSLSFLPWRWTKRFRWCTTHWPPAKCCQPLNFTGGVPLWKANRSIISLPAWLIRRLSIWNCICRIARPGETRVHPVARSFTGLPQNWMGTRQIWHLRCRRLARTAGSIS